MKLYAGNKLFGKYEKEDIVELDNIIAKGKADENVVIKLQAFIMENASTRNFFTNYCSFRC